MGLAIAAAAGVAYVAVWEIYLALTDRLEAMRVNYADPPLRIPMIFMKIFPVGLLVALVSALLLRNPGILPATR
jgi:hypothetical protein